MINIVSIHSKVTNNMKFCYKNNDQWLEFIGIKPFYLFARANINIVLRLALQLLSISALINYYRA